MFKNIKHHSASLKKPSLIRGIIYPSLFNGNSPKLVTEHFADDLEQFNQAYELNTEIPQINFQDSDKGSGPWGPWSSSGSSNSS
ncbi:MAG: hypothetical protein ACKO47_03045, partial [Alphaproteobacteria bacterium]